MIRDGSGPKACHFFIKAFVTELYDFRQIYRIRQVAEVINGISG